MPPPRFLLILSVNSNLLRAALVTRESQLVASAQQTFQQNQTDFDPAEVWYKTKKVIAACLDIGRTLSREVAGVVIVSQPDNMVQWRDKANDVEAYGGVGQVPRSDLASDNNVQQGTIGTWLLWNLSGVSEIGNAKNSPKTRERAPFDAELPIFASLAQAQALEWSDPADDKGADRAILGAARYGWNLLSEVSQNEFAGSGNS